MAPPEVLVPIIRTVGAIVVLVRLIAIALVRALRFISIAPIITPTIVRATPIVAVAPIVMVSAVIVMIVVPSVINGRDISLAGGGLRWRDGGGLRNAGEAGQCGGDDGRSEHFPCHVTLLRND